MAREREVEAVVLRVVMGVRVGVRKIFLWKVAVCAVMENVVVTEGLWCVELGTGSLWQELALGQFEQARLVDGSFEEKDCGGVILPATFKAASVV